MTILVLYQSLKKDDKSFFLVHLSTLIECLAYVGCGVAESRLKRSKAERFLFRVKNFEILGSAR